VSQKSDFFTFFGAPTTKAVGSNFVTYLEPTALVVGARIKKANIKSKWTNETTSFLPLSDVRYNPDFLNKD
jgi:hypothetical protein